MRSMERLVLPPRTTCRKCGTPYPPDSVVGRRRCAACREQAMLRSRQVKAAMRIAAREGRRIRKELGADAGKHRPHVTAAPLAEQGRTYTVHLPEHVHVSMYARLPAHAVPEPDTDPPPRLLLAGPWAPPRFDRKGRML